MSQKETTSAVAERARIRLAAAPAGSLSRKAAGCAVIVLNDSRTVTGALRMLATARLDDTVRTATADLIHQLTAATETTANPKENA